MTLARGYHRRAMPVPPAPEASPAPPPRRYRRLLWGIEIFAVYTLIAANFATQSAIRGAHTAGAAPWWKLFAFGIAPTFYSWALVTPAIVWVARRHGFERGRRWRALAAHLGAMLVIAPLQTGADFLMTVGSRLVFGDAAGAAAVIDRAVPVLLAGSIDVPQMYATIAAIAYTFNYYRMFRARELRASQLEAQLGGARLQMLRMQLQPHFLFNTLNAISALMHRDLAAAERMLARLADLLRLSLDEKAEPEISLRRELEVLEPYLEIERVRFSDRLSVAFDIGAGTLEAAVPNLILQPLVENAVRHGLAPSAAPGEIRVSSRRADGFLLLEVADNGVGLRGATDGTLREGIGLANTRARLAQLYGDDARCELAEAGTGGLAVRLRLPFRPAAHGGTGDDAGGREASR